MTSYTRDVAADKVLEAGFDRFLPLKRFNIELYLYLDQIIVILPAAATKSHRLIVVNEDRYNRLFKCYLYTLYR
jgi:hypothetical protein